MPAALTVGWVYNLHDPNATTSAPRLITVCLVFSTLAVLASGLRFWLRRNSVAGIGIDDYTLMLSVVLGAAYSGVSIYQTRWGQALDTQYFPAENIIEFSKVQYAGGPIYCLALLGFKVSLLASYFRLGGVSTWYRRIVWVITGMVIANQISFALVLSLGCHPVARQWDTNITEGGCINTIASYFALAGSSLTFDVIIIALPFPVLYRLQLDLQRKITIVGMFALGFFVTIIQIIRIFTIANLKTYTNSNAIVNWSAVEINLGVIVACIPTYGIVLRQVLSKLPTRWQPSFVRGPHGTPGYSASYELEQSNRRTHMMNGQNLDSKALASLGRAHTTSKALSSPTHAYGVSHGRMGESTEHIVPAQPQPARGSDEIVVTTDIRVTNEERLERQASRGSGSLGLGEDMTDRRWEFVGHDGVRR